MISGSRTTLPLLALLTIATPFALANDDAAELIGRLAKPAPASIAFTEVRFSPLLKAPLFVAGELVFTSATSLDRHVTEPYREDTEIRGDSVRVLREGEAPRSFALKRAPELRVLLDGFGALLSGDAASVERAFTAQVRGVPDRWVLELTPIDARARKRLKQIRVDGRDATPRCFSIDTTDGGTTVMLLGEWQKSLSALMDAPQLARRCAAAP